MKVVDSHIHCGIQNVNQPYGQIEPLLKDAGIFSACLFAPVEDIYYRYSSAFDDNEAWRACRVNAHHYLLRLSQEKEGIYPYYFVWNDFMVEDLERNYCGIKWHHHPGEPPYHYQDPRCADMIDAICARNLPIVLEETCDQTLKFIERVAGRTSVIIPHLGLLNGGFDRLLHAGIWQDANVYADTALAGTREITIFLEKFGADKLVFGSDYPFGLPEPQLQRLTRMGIKHRDLEKICAGNILKLITL
ncbi:MAG: amidohydrolase family protein [Deltaproteobacteria bacterium]|nr:MAG: amidohydrolase family protein [Deltaproteobacteria bacterium]